MLQAAARMADLAHACCPELSQQHSRSGLLSPWFCATAMLLCTPLFSMHRWFLSSLLSGCVTASRWGYTLMCSEAGVTACALGRKEHASCGGWILSKLGLFARRVVTFGSKNLRAALCCVLFSTHHPMLDSKEFWAAATSQICICLGVAGIPPPSYGQQIKPSCAIVARIGFGRSMARHLFCMIQ